MGARHGASPLTAAEVQWDLGTARGQRGIGHPERLRRRPTGCLRRAARGVWNRSTACSLELHPLRFSQPEKRELHMWVLKKWVSANATLLKTERALLHGPSGARRIIRSQTGLGGKGPLKATQSNPLPWAGTSPTSSGCSEPHPTWPGMVPGTGHLPSLWAAWARVSPPSA